MVGTPAGEMTGGVDETDTSDWSVLGSVTLRCGVESEVPFDVEVSSVALGAPVKVWVPLDTPVLPLSGSIPPED